ncbi:hypothetical protein FOZ60_013472 [Perkinsus olseni]|uniref:Uncharacterized protein n=1 Tax=Perkinsus olseni TaxID=32597 RepID=A0A7J6N979_PEROL|nr:hypothetical protein FOZ60_013472 [Perkinsus olseni]
MEFPCKCFHGIQLYYSGGRLSGVVAAHVSTTTNVHFLVYCRFLLRRRRHFWWHWKDDQPPLNPIYSRLAKYPVKLTAQQEQQYDQELSSWISSGWLIPGSSP